MGSTTVDQDHFTVLVTGFGPFKEQFPVNPSWEIASRLPDYLPPIRAKSAAAKSAATSPVLLPPVRILVYPEPVRVNYQTVRALVPELWDGRDGSTAGHRIDAVVHIGMAGPRMHWSLERRGHRVGYAQKDVDGGLLGDEERSSKEGKDWIWYGVPDELLTELDLEDLLRRWKEHSPDGLDLRISEDAGRYLCDFIYFSSLAHLWKAKEPRRVVFLHVPSDSSEQSVATGLELVVQLIRSVAESELAQKSVGV